MLCGIHILKPNERQEAKDKITKKATEIKNEILLNNPPSNSDVQSAMSELIQHAKGNEGRGENA